MVILLGSKLKNKKRFNISRVFTFSNPLKSRNRLLHLLQNVLVMFRLKVLSRKQQECSNKQRRSWCKSQWNQSFIKLPFVCWSSISQRLNKGLSHLETGWLLRSGMFTFSSPKVVKKYSHCCCCSFPAYLKVVAQFPHETCICLESPTKLTYRWRTAATESVV